MTRLPILIAAGALLAGCAGGMSRNECELADWRLVGYEDGSRGATMGAMSQRRKACADRARVAPDMAEYRAGREEGLREFCRPAKGFVYGAHGKYYAGVCPADLEMAFLDHYEKGKKLFQLTAACTRAENALDSAHAQIDANKLHEAKVQQRLVSLTTPNADRINLGLKLKQLYDERERLKKDIPAFEEEVDDAKEELAEYRDYLAEEGIYSGGPGLPATVDY